MIFLKSLAGGVGAVILAWIALITVYMIRLGIQNKEAGRHGLYAVAGGWDHLIQRPLTVILLSASFAAGLYLAAKWSRT